MAPFVFIVSNNAAWNIERYDQAENYGGRVVGTTLKHSDYAGMARAFDAYVSEWKHRTLQLERNADRDSLEAILRVARLRS